jgi:hypothetical protein
VTINMIMFEFYRKSIMLLVISDAQIVQPVVL